MDTVFQTFSIIILTIITTNWNLLHFKTDNHILITGYKSPSTPNVVFTNALDTILTSCEIDACIIVIGDFNFDVLEAGNYLSCFMNKHNLYSILQCEATTNMNTQIDVVFTNSPNVSGGIYETFFSYHKPIFVASWKESIAMESNTTTNCEKGSNVKELPDTIGTHTTAKYGKWGFGTTRSVRKQRDAVTVSDSLTPQTCNKAEIADITGISSRRSTTLAPATFTYNIVDSNWQAERCAVLGLYLINEMPPQNTLYDVSLHIPPTSRVVIRGDGNCFFRSISWYMTGSEDQHSEVRQLMISHVMRNYEAIKAFSGKSEEDFSGMDS